MAKSDEKIYGIYSGSLQWPEMIDKLNEVDLIAAEDTRHTLKFLYRSMPGADYIITIFANQVVASLTGEFWV